MKIKTQEELPYLDYVFHSAYGFGPAFLIDPRRPVIPAKRQHKSTKAITSSIRLETEIGRIMERFDEVFSRECRL